MNLPSFFQLRIIAPAFTKWLHHYPYSDGLRIIAPAFTKWLHHYPYFDGKTVIFPSKQGQQYNNLNGNKGNGVKS
jgi:hypothetical protein